MLNHLRVTWAMIAVLAGMMGCGSYSSPDDGNSPTAPDSTADSTPPPPDYLLK